MSSLSGIVSRKFLSRPSSLPSSVPHYPYTASASHQPFKVIDEFPARANTVIAILSLSSLLAIIATSTRGEYGFFQVKACYPGECVSYGNPCAGKVPRSFKNVCGMSQWKGAQACLILCE
ncbi:hypothetical protein HDU67_009502 [Dinochytrium kinnereticum]|nr:hypothetical protein HDU67_009502 [Dinochytrium kinnereticum]